MAFSEQAKKLKGEHGGVWGRHPDYPVDDWQTEVANDDTRQGYWEWDRLQQGHPDLGDAL